MNSNDQYIQLLTSLPQFASIFGARQTPLSRIKLDQRLKLLSESDQQRLSAIESVIEWDSNPHFAHYDQVVSKFKQLLLNEQDTKIKAIINFRLDLRTLVAALKAQAGGKTLQGEWTVSHLKSTIERNWQSGTFKLEHRFNWLVEAKQLIASDQHLALETLIFKQLWQFLRKHSEHNQYGFAAVVSYVLQWDLVSRWLSYRSECAGERYQKLLLSVMPSENELMVMMSDSHN